VPSSPDTLQLSWAAFSLTCKARPIGWPRKLMHVLAFSRSTVRRRMASLISSVTVCWIGSTAMGAAAFASASRSAAKMVHRCPHARDQGEPPRNRTTDLVPSRRASVRRRTRRFPSPGGGDRAL
jgi:hypothetical protein